MNQDMMRKKHMFLGQFSTVFFSSRKAAFISSIFSIAVAALFYIAYLQIEEATQIELPTGQADIKTLQTSTGFLTPSQEVLVLSSYHVGHSWSDNEIAGIMETFREASDKISCDIEYLDCKRHPKFEHFEKVKALFELKYGKRTIPLVIVADNPALEFALKYRSQLFPRAAIVFCGVNNYRKEMLGGQENITGLAEALDADDTMRIALKLHPTTREVFVLHDYTSSGLATRKETEEQMKGMFDKISFRYVEDFTRNDLTQLLKGLPADSLVLALTYSVFKDGEVIGHEDLARLLSANSPVPVYGVHQERLGYGIVGGSLLSGRLHGAQAAWVALKILSGTPASAIPVDLNPPTRMMFDHNQLVRFGIPLKALPEGSIVVNRPIPFTASHIYLVVSTLLVIMILTSGIIILGFNVYQRKLAEEALRKSKEELEMRVSERTAELHNANEQMQFELTERKKAEEALQKSEQRLQLHVRQTPLAVIEWDPDFCVISWNPAAEKIFGYSMAEALGHHAKFIVPVIARPHVDRVWGDLLLRRGGERSTNENVTKDGSTILCEWYNTPLITADGRVIGVASLVQDITERKRGEQEIQKAKEELEQRVRERTTDLQKMSTELQENQMALMNIVEDLNGKTAELEHANIKLQELDQLKSMFIASMSHELRTPLNSIIGFSSIMLNEWTGPLTLEQKDNLSAVLRSGKHLLSLINDVIDVSKIEAGKIESIAEDFDVCDVVMEAVDTLKKDAENKGLELRVQALRQVVHADRRRLLQCLLNMIGNAVKYTQQGSIKVSTQVSSDGSMMTLTVEDTGIGIREDDLNRLFLPFVRLHPPMGSIVPGTGLGLYLTKKLAQEILKGDILVSSTYGAGTRFTLRVPVAG